MMDWRYISRASTCYFRHDNEKFRQLSVLAFLLLWS